MSIWAKNFLYSLIMLSAKAVLMMLLILIFKLFFQNGFPRVPDMRYGFCFLYA